VIQEMAQSLRHHNKQIRQLTKCIELWEGSEVTVCKQTKQL